jgi:hypothetical protein
MKPLAYLETYSSKRTPQAYRNGLGHFFESKYPEEEHASCLILMVGLVSRGRNTPCPRDRLLRTVGSEPGEPLPIETDALTFARLHLRDTAEPCQAAEGLVWA